MAYYPAISTDYNFTLSYSLDSTFPIYHMISNTLKPDHMRTPVPYATKRRAEWLSAWISNCHARNNRLQLLTYLERELGAVRKIGRCFRASDRGLDKESESSKHLFMYAAENSNCPYYHTEKIFHAFMAGTVPIYVGADSISHVIPPKSAVLVSEFTQEGLVDHLRHLEQNESAYNEYLAWRSNPLPPVLSNMLREAKTTYDATWRCNACRIFHTCTAHTRAIDFSCSRPDTVPVSTTCSGIGITTPP